MTMPSSKLRLWQRPLAYRPVLEAMQRFTDERTEHTADEFWLLQHEPVFTQGRSIKQVSTCIESIVSDRGGDLTYHAPGQWILYCLINLKRAGCLPSELVRRAECIVEHTLQNFGIRSHKRAKMPGVYVQNAKIASLGFRVRRHCSLHGLALNTQMDLKPFRQIAPCGYRDMAVTQLADHTQYEPSLPEVAAVMMHAVQTQFHCLLIQTQEDI